MSFDMHIDTEKKQDFEIIVFTKNNCPRCDYVKRTFQKKNIQFASINVETNTDRIDALNDTAINFVTNNLRLREMPVILVSPNKVMSHTESDLSVDDNDRIVATGIPSELIDSLVHAANNESPTVTRVSSTAPKTG